jgi:hypothetical protein
VIPRPECFYSTRGFAFVVIGCHVDTLYRTRANRSYSKELKIRLSGKSLGRPELKISQNAAELKAGKYSNAKANVTACQSKVSLATVSVKTHSDVSWANPHRTAKVWFILALLSLNYRNDYGGISRITQIPRRHRLLPASYDICLDFS